jgi:hypothetical protein
MEPKPRKYRRNADAGDDVLSNGVPRTPTDRAASRPSKTDEAPLETYEQPVPRGESTARDEP